MFSHTSTRANRWRNLVFNVHIQNGDKSNFHKYTQPQNFNPKFSLKTQYPIPQGKYLIGKRQQMHYFKMINTTGSCGAA